jgi:hypothetical protein
MNTSPLTLRDPVTAELPVILEFPETSRTLLLAGVLPIPRLLVIDI